MFESMKKSLLAGVGLALKSKNEIEEIAKEFAQKSKMNQEEGRKLLDDLLKKYDDTREKLNDKVEEIVERVLEKADLPSRALK